MDGGFCTTCQKLSTTLWNLKGCAWSRSLDPNFCSGRGLNLGPLTWQSSAQPLDHRAPLAPRAPLPTSILLPLFYSDFIFLASAYEDEWPVLFLLCVGANIGASVCVYQAAQAAQTPVFLGYSPHFKHERNAGVAAHIYIHYTVSFITFILSLIHPILPQRRDN